MWGGSYPGVLLLLAAAAASSQGGGWLSPEGPALLLEGPDDQQAGGFLGGQRVGPERQAPLGLGRQEQLGAQLSQGLLGVAEGDGGWRGEGGPEATPSPGCLGGTRKEDGSGSLPPPDGAPSVQLPTPPLKTHQLLGMGGGARRAGESPRRQTETTQTYDCNWEEDFRF